MWRVTAIFGGMDWVEEVAVPVDGFLEIKNSGPGFGIKGDRKIENVTSETTAL